MVIQSQIQVTVSVTEVDLNETELQAAVQNLLPQLRKVDGVEDANLVAVENAPENSKALGGFLLGKFKAVVNPAFIKPVFGFLSKFSSKTFELEIEAYGEKIKVKASNSEDFTVITQEVQNFLNNAKNRQDS